MRKKLFLLFALCMPFLLNAQLMDTANVIDENFEGATLSVVPATSSFDPLGDWKLDNTLSVSPTHSYHCPVYSTSNNCLMTTSPIALAASSVQNVTHFYLEFDHICKVSQLDQTNIVYYLGYVGANGVLQWSTAQTLSFSSTDAFYYGGANTSLTSGKFNDACYTVWNANTPAAVPNNNWWQHELFDLTSFLLNKTVTVAGVQHQATHVRIGFRVNKTSPSASGTEACAGWYIDNLKCILSNCELIKPVIALQPTVYVNKNSNLLNNIGPYTIKARITDNDQVQVDSLKFRYRINSGQMINVPNTITSNTTSGGTNVVLAQWDVPSICYYDTIRYQIYVRDVHGSTAIPVDTPLIAWHNQTNIHNNDCHLDSLNTFPHCFITGVAEPVTLYFKNKSDAANSPGSPYQTSLSVTMKVQNENHVQTHSSTHNWTGSLCFDERDFLSLGNFTPSHGFNYITVYVTSRNGQADGFHGATPPTNGTSTATSSDTLRFIGYACDSLLHGDYTVGGTNPDFASMTEVKAALNYCGINGPTTFHLRPGTYQDFDFTDNYIGQSSTNLPPIPSPSKATTSTA